MLSETLALIVHIPKIYLRINNECSQFCEDGSVQPNKVLSNLIGFSKCRGVGKTFTKKHRVFVTYAFVKIY